MVQLFTIIKLPSTGGTAVPITVCFIEHCGLTKSTHSCLCNPHSVDSQAGRAYLKQLTVSEIRTLVRCLPVFFNPPKSPELAPIVPKDPSPSVTLLITESSPFSPFIRVVTAPKSAEMESMIKKCLIWGIKIENNSYSVAFVL